MINCKWLILGVLVLCLGFVNGATYYVSNSGNDSNSGASPEQAWASLQKVQNVGLLPGDIVLFKRGDVWRTVEELSTEFKIPSGTSSQRITIGSYGAGSEKPYIIGSISKNKTSDWTNTTGNLWRTSLPSYRSPTQVVFNFWASNGLHAIPGTRNWFGETHATRTTNPNAQGEWEYDTYLYVYSIDNPAIHYSSIEVVVEPTDWSTFDDIIDLGSYVTIDGLFIGLSSRHGVNTANDGVIIRNSDIAFCGKQVWKWHNQSGTYLLNGIGNGIQFWQASGQTVSDGIVEKNRIWQCFDACITNQGTTGIGENITYRNNIVFKCEYGMEVWTSTSGYINDGIYIYHNTFAFNGYGWGHERGIPPGSESTRGLDFSLFRRNENIAVKNNIFYKPRWCSSATEFADYPSYDLNYNLYYAPDAPLLFRNGMYNASGYTALQWNQFRSNLNKEVNGTYADPLFVDPENYDFGLSRDSPAINIGVDININEDFLGNARSSIPDIGAIEYTGTIVPPAQENCGNSIDDDSDGLIDCRDSDCPACVVVVPPAIEECGNALAVYRFNESGGVAGKFGNARNFDGIDDYVAVSGVDLTRKSFSVSAWVRPSSGVPTQTYFSAHDNSSKDKSLVLRIYDTGKIRFGFYADDLDSVDGVVRFGEWQNIVATFNSVNNVSRIYVNGSLVAEGIRGPFAGENADVGIGKLMIGSGSQFFRGDIDEFVVFNKALSPSEVLSLSASSISCVSISLDDIFVKISEWKAGRVSLGDVFGVIQNWINS
jgi:hypothetical protein